LIFEVAHDHKSAIRNKQSEIDRNLGVVKAGEMADR